MNTFTQHIPDFLDGYTPIEFDFDTKDELLNHEIVSEFKITTDFNKFVLRKSCYQEWSSVLCAIYGENDIWIIGFIKNEFEL
jgi:hypothetical protein